MEQIRLITDLSPYRGWIDRALSYDIDGNTILEVVERVKSGEFIAVEVKDKAILIVNILEGENRVLNVVLAAGWAMPLWLRDATDFLKNLARDQSCSRVRMQGRRGWVKILNSHGFHLRASVMEASV